MKPKGKRHNTIPISLGGQSSAGDPSMLADGFVSVLRNYVIRPNRFEGRAPFVYDSLDTVNGFAVWQDLVNELQKTVAMRSADNKLYTKNTNGVGYGAGLSGLTASSRLTGWTNFLGKLWMAFDNGAGVPTSMASYDGTNLVVTPFNSAINARSIVAYDNRNFLIDPRATISPLAVASTQLIVAYDATHANWVKTNITASNILNASGGKTVCRLFPTSTAASACQIEYNRVIFGIGTGTVQAPASTTPLNYVWRSNLQAVHPSYDVPITLEAVAFGNVPATTSFAVTVGYLMVQNGFILRCVVAGTTAAIAPAYSTTLGATTVDGTATWLTESADVMASVETTIQNATASPNFLAIYLPITVPQSSSGINFKIRIKLYNTAYPALTTLAPINISLKDGLADGDPGKVNKGQQVTLGDFYYPFFNTETATSSTAAIDAVIWSEIENPKQILARNTYPLAEIAGLATVAIVSNGRLVVFKRSGMWIFKGNADPYEPILPESPALSVGCIGPRALDTSRDNMLYWIGENHVYRMKIGSDELPQEIDSPGMFEEIFSRGSGWVESQSTYNLPLLAIDHANKDVWIYTQKGKIYVYSIQSGLWSYFDTNPTGTSAEVAAMIFDPVSNRMLVSFGGASATRFDETSDASDSIVTGGGTAWNAAHDIVPKPFELFAARYEATLLECGLFHLATIQNGSLSVSYSYDRGATYTTPSGYPVTAWLGNPRIRLPVTATGESVTVKFSHVGAGGKRNWSVSKADVLLRVHRGEASKVNAT